MALVHATQNVANLEACYGALAYVLGMAENQIYSASFGPAITQPALVWLAVIIVLTLEYATGLLALKGAWNLWRARGVSAEDFNRSKNTAILGCGMAMVTWYGLFVVLGSGLFNMWQTAVGDGSFKGAFIFGSIGALTLLVVNSDNRD